VVQLIETAVRIREEVAAARRLGRRVGLVPTMGALHEGHVQLIARCRDLVDVVVVSIFVNPTQFGPGEDFERYPRALDLDLQKCERAGGDLVFAPAVSTMYPSGPQSTFVEVGPFSHILEGATRPGHFRGVATVVLKLFEIVRPDLAVFGQKDYQQQLLIRRMVDDLHLPILIRTCPTIRESDGLALSSRNRYLSPIERRAAIALYRGLESAKRAVADGERQADQIRQILRETIESEVLAKLDYAEVADSETLEPLGDLGSGRSAVCLVAAWLGTTRLIDNALLME
jgi:pantoate--beta-alanine ligase